MDVGVRVLLHCARAGRAGVVEVCPRSPPGLLSFTDDLVLCSANGTLMITQDGGRSWNRTSLPSEFRPSIPPPRWRQKLGKAGAVPTATSVLVDVNPVDVYICDYPGKPACSTEIPPPPIVAAPNRTYCDWGLDDTTGLPVVFCSLGRPRPNVWSGLPHFASEFCTDCGQGVQLPDGSFVYIVVVQLMPDWEPKDHSKALPCCNNSVVAYVSKDGQSWEYTSAVAPYDVAKYNGMEGPNECALVLLRDNRTLFAVMRVDGGDGPIGIKPLLSATSLDGGVSWHTAPLPTDMLAAQPRAVVLDNGALLVTVGRPGVDLFVSADGFGRSWDRYSLPTFHNRLVDTQHEEEEWKFCAAYEKAAANHTFQDDPHRGWTQSDGYNAIAAVGHDTALVCYDRMGVSQGPFNNMNLPCWTERRNYTECSSIPWPNGWALPFDCGLDHSTTYCMRVTVEATPRGDLPE